MRSVLSPKELAEAIGVSESSLKRWADEGRIHVSRTAGGHRRIPFAEAIRFIRESQATVVRPDILGLNDMGQALQRADPDRIGDPEAAFAEALQAGDASAVRGLLVAWYLQGHALPPLLDGPVRLAMHRVGALWEHDDRGIFVEHRATDLCVDALNHLRWLLPKPADNAPIAMGGAAELDPYLIPSLMCSVVLADLGFRVTNLGPHTPHPTLRRAAEEYHARLLWLSFSAPTEPRRIREQVEPLANALATHGASLVIGGRAVPPAFRIDAPNLAVMHGMTELAAFARGLMTAAGSHTQGHAPESDPDPDPDHAPTPHPGGRP